MLEKHYGILTSVLHSSFTRDKEFYDATREAVDKLVKDNSEEKKDGAGRARGYSDAFEDTVVTGAAVLGEPYPVLAEVEEMSTPLRCLERGASEASPPTYVVNQLTPGYGSPKEENKTWCDTIRQSCCCSQRTGL